MKNTAVENMVPALDNHTEGTHAQETAGVELSISKKADTKFDVEATKGVTKADSALKRFGSKIGSWFSNGLDSVVDKSVKFQDKGIGAEDVRAVYENAKGGLSKGLDNVIAWSVKFRDMGADTDPEKFFSKRKESMAILTEQKKEVGNLVMDAQRLKTGEGLNAAKQGIAERFELLKGFGNGAQLSANFRHLNLKAQYDEKKNVMRAEAASGGHPGHVSVIQKKINTINEFTKLGMPGGHGSTEHEHSFASSQH